MLCSVSRIAYSVLQIKVYKSPVLFQRSELLHLSVWGEADVRASVTAGAHDQGAPS